ncbi:hypothetical protein I317_06180 [Kwoniella heveanensis CBS 569]|nr:hypothetical protein I317_06180 [Kwoniella heveanensis CBS 569]
MSGSSTFQPYDDVQSDSARPAGMPLKDQTKTSLASVQVLESAAEPSERFASGQDDNFQTVQVLEKGNFGFVSAFGYAFSVINSWVIMVAAIGSGLVSGGPSSLVWGLLYASISNYATVLSHNECFAVYPSAGGQYHWAAVLSPPRFRELLSWLTGMLNVIGLWLGAASSAYLSSNLLISIVLLLDPEWEVTPRIQYGLFVVTLSFLPIVNVFIGQKLGRRLDYALMILSTITVLVIIITLPAAAPHRAPASFVFGGLSNLTGWDSMVMAWLLGLLQSAFAYLGFDAIYHISEEMPNPRTDGPRAVAWTIIISFVSAMAVLVSMLFCVVDLERVLSTPYGLPFAQIALDATSSKAATVIFILIPTMLLLNTCRGISMGASRVLLSLARDNVLPYPKVWCYTYRGEPIVGLAVSLLVPLSCGLVQLGSTAAFNSLLGAAVIVFQVSYVIPPALMLFGGRRQLNRDFPQRTSNLGRWGVVCNLISMFFVLQSCVIYCFPATMPVTADTMSYVVVFLGFFGGLLSVLWFAWAKKRYIAPSREAVLALTTVTSEIEEES